MSTPTEYQGLTLTKLNDLWLRWQAQDHNEMRFGQYVMSKVDFIPPPHEEAAWGIDLFYETDAEKCFKFLTSVITDYHE